MTRVCTAVLRKEVWVPQQSMSPLPIKIDVAPDPGKEVSMQGVLTAAGGNGFADIVIDYYIANGQQIRPGRVSLIDATGVTEVQFLVETQTWATGAGMVFVWDNI
jgi:hypothetical protein